MARRVCAGRPFDPQKRTGCFNRRLIACIRAEIARRRERYSGGGGCTPDRGARHSTGELMLAPCPPRARRVYRSNNPSWHASRVSLIIGRHGAWVMKGSQGHCVKSAIQPLYTSEMPPAAPAEMLTTHLCLDSGEGRRHARCPCTGWLAPNSGTGLCQTAVTFVLAPSVVQQWASEQCCTGKSGKIAGAGRLGGFGLLAPSR